MVFKTVHDFYQSNQKELAELNMPPQYCHRVFLDYSSFPKSFKNVKLKGLQILDTNIVVNSRRYEFKDYIELDIGHSKVKACIPLPDGKIVDCLCDKLVGRSLINVFGHAFISSYSGEILFVLSHYSLAKIRKVVIKQPLYACVSH